MIIVNKLTTIENVWIYFYVLIFLIGLSVGSFFNVVIFRFGTGKSIVKGRSKCPNCDSVIRWFNLVPVLSYFMLQSRCRACNKKISPLYPVVEISTAAILLLLFLNTPVVSHLTALNAFIILFLVLVIFLDIRYLIIPDKILILLAIAAVGLKLLTGNANFIHLFISALGLTAFFAILYTVSRGEWIGLGDIKLIFFIGFLLGYPMGYLAIVTAVWLAAIFSIILLATGKANVKTEIPFGSFLSAATIIFIIFNNELQEITKYFQ
ncbi:MAG: prepilin peptidase [Candidatus Yanofskybacteria bacterium]|nr:prepilin peptidase [Candidatus Yanofskybacteria bacterium]